MIAFTRKPQLQQGAWHKKDLSVSDGCFAPRPCSRCYVLRSFEHSACMVYARSSNAVPQPRCRKRFMLVLPEHTASPYGKPCEPKISNGPPWTDFFCISQHRIQRTINYIPLQWRMSTNTGFQADLRTPVATSDPDSKREPYLGPGPILARNCETRRNPLKNWDSLSSPK